MSSPTLTHPAGPPKITGRVTPKSSSRFPRGKTVAIIGSVAVCVVLCLASLLASRFWPFSAKAIVEDLAEASDNTVTIRSSHQTYFPVPGCVLEDVQFDHGPNTWTLITIDKVTIQGSYLGILTRHVPRVTVEGGHVYVPPFGSNVPFKTQHSKLVVEEIIATGAVVEFSPDDPQKKSLRFEVADAVLRDVRWGSPIKYELKVHNPKPPGEIVTRGQFGAWTTGNPGETPMSGEYTFDHADLGVYGGIAGTLSSSGKYSGVLKHIDIAGTTDVPDFEVKSGGHKVKLATRFAAYVDAIHGDTFLKRVDVQFGRTNLVVEGSVAGANGTKGKAARLDMTSRHGRIEDVLGLFVKAPRSPMSGEVALRAKAEIPPGKESFLRKVKLEGTFGVEDGSFSKAETQKNVNELSAGARGEKMDDAETALTDLKGRVALAGGIATFSDLSFGVPGVKARMYGAYNLLNEKIDLHGRMRVDTKISKTETGMKSFLLKALDPFFKKKKKGEVVPIHITGTYEHPQFGLDLTSQKGHEQINK